MINETLDLLGQKLDLLRSEFLQWLAALKAYWDIPEFEAVREVCERDDFTSDYYWAWYRRFAVEFLAMHQELVLLDRLGSSVYVQWNELRRAVAAAN